MNRDVTVVIPTIPPRSDLLDRAVRSVMAQTHPAEAIVTAIDSRREGAWTTRNKGLHAVRTTWTAFLDDDDELQPHHLQFLLDRAEEHDVDLVWGWFDVIGGTDPFPLHRGRQYDPAEPHIFPITYVVRTELLHAAVAEMGGFQPDTIGSWMAQDRPVIDGVIRHGGRLMAFPESTWWWHHHGANTSGLPTRW